MVSMTNSLAILLPPLTLVAFTAQAFVSPATLLLRRATPCVTGSVGQHRNSCDGRRSYRNRVRVFKPVHPGLARIGGGALSMSQDVEEKEASGSSVGGEAAEQAAKLRAIAADLRIQVSRT